MKNQEFTNLKRSRKLASKLGLDVDYEIYFVDSAKWLGDYGYIGNVKKGLAGIKYLLNNLRRLDVLVSQEHGNVFLTIKGRTSVLHIAETDVDLLHMANGQLFDIGDKNYGLTCWYSKSDSKFLKKEIDMGYDYYNPNYFYNDFFPIEEVNEEEIA